MNPDKKSVFEINIPLVDKVLGPDDTRLHLLGKSLKRLGCFVIGIAALLFVIFEREFVTT